MRLADKYTRLELMIYLVCWIIIFSIPFGTQLYDVLSGQALTFHWASVNSSLMVLFPIFLFFVLNNWVLLPYVFWRKHWLLYLLCIIVALVVLWYLQNPTHPPQPLHVPPPPGGRRPIDMFRVTNVIIELCVVFANFAIKLYIHSLRRDAQQLDAKNQRMTSELDALRYQISPHFLMNTLNNIQSLIDIDPKRAYQTIQELSKMMRYMLYENNTATVPLHKELDFIRNFVALMRIRYPEKVEINVNLPDNDRGAQVAPMLFVSFLENAFKYGVSYSRPSRIDVTVAVTDDALFFVCQNTINVKSSPVKAHGGIGIDNVRRRLNLIYGTSYKLYINQDNDIYTVKMTLPV